jgi:RimJ/RimL family protein N-acetyltransferase
MEYPDTEKRWINLKGRQVYLKKLSHEYVNEFSDYTMNTCIETRIMEGMYVSPSPDNIAMYLEAISKDRTTIHFLIFLNENDTMVGEVVISDIDYQNKSANIRIEIGNSQNYRKGYGFEALFLALNYAFGMINLHRIELDVFRDNLIAQGLYEKIGFKREGIKRSAYYYEYSYRDLVIMSILKDEFEEIRKIAIAKTGA